MRSIIGFPITFSATPVAETDWKHYICATEAFRLSSQASPTCIGSSFIV
jgi:hypothetical protein